jgi:hypothetical protein
MSCCGKLKAERLKAFSHAQVLACQAANITGKKQAIIIVNSQYGKHYDIIEHEKAEGKEIIQYYIKGSKIKKRPKKVAEHL